jgi:hypothetical protein
MARQLQDSFWKKDRQGREVVQAYYSTHFQIVKEGDEVEVGGRVFVVAAVGEVFKIGKEKFNYLYPAVPVATRQPVVTETPDEPLDRLESERTRELGRSGELPGA